MIIYTCVYIYTINPYLNFQYLISYLYTFAYIYMYRTNFVTRYWFETPPDDRVHSDSCIKGCGYVFIAGRFEMNPNFNYFEFYIRYIISIRSLVDLACIIPSFFELSYLTRGVSVNTTFVRVLRVFRVFRVLKLLLASKKVRTMLKLIVMALQMSKDVLILLTLTSFTLSVFFGSILFTVEKGTFTVSDSFPDGYFSVPTNNQYSTQQSLFESAFTGIYASVITLTTGKRYDMIRYNMI